MSANEKALTASLGKLADLNKAYEGLISSPEERALFDRFAPALCASMTYVVRMVQIDSDKAMPDAERVRQRTFEIARGPE